MKTFSKNCVVQLPMGSLGFGHVHCPGASWDRGIIQNTEGQTFALQCQQANHYTMVPPVAERRWGQQTNHYTTVAPVAMRR